MKKLTKPPGAMHPTGRCGTCARLPEAHTHPHGAHRLRLGAGLHRMALLSACLLLAGLAGAVDTPTMIFPRAFSPLDGLLTAPERQHRDERCLNGLWRFHPCAVPRDWKPETGVAPELPPPTAAGWEAVSIRIPSTWNINAVLHDASGAGFDARCFPSYPAAWNEVRMGWLRRTVEIPASWSGRSILLHLEAVAGECQVFVNGTSVGSHFDLALPCAMDVTRHLRPGPDNEILLGIRHHRLFDHKGTHGRMVVPAGSFWLDQSVGVWQDVFLEARPRVAIADVQVMPDRAQDELRVAVTVRNDGVAAATVAVEVPVHHWINRARLDGDPRTAPEPDGAIGDEALRLTAPPVTVAPGSSVTVTAAAKVGGRLKTWEAWTRGEPHLSMAVARLVRDGAAVDTRCARFGWRDIAITGGEIRLNGTRIRLPMDGWHFTGVGNMTRRHAWAWYTLARKAHIPFVRPHAMPWPRYYYDLADEMGMLILDETGIFGSSINLNYDSETFWEHAKTHVAGLVRRDRNHPSVVGWSVANEVWCVLRSQATPAYGERIYDHLRELGDIARSLDPTRNWVQSDGDRDLGGRFPIRTIHTGGDWDRALDTTTMPWGVTEGGSSYFGKPSHYEPLVGGRAYRSFGDRMDGLAIECYQLIRALRAADADIFNAWNLAWHAQKPLPLGLTDPAKRRVGLADGIAFPPYVEGRPGIQPERLPPWCLTLNPGYDPRLPLHDPWPLHHALVAAFAPAGPQPCAWDRRDPGPEPKKAPTIAPTNATAGFAGTANAPLRELLTALGVTLAGDADSGFLIVDAATCRPQDTARMQGVITRGGTVLILNLDASRLATINAALPAPLAWRPGQHVSLLAAADDSRTASLTGKQLYFNENPVSCTVATGTLSGPFLEGATVLLRSNPTDWRRWLQGGEWTTTISIARSERENVAEPVLVERRAGPGRWLLATLATERLSDEHVALYRHLLAGCGLAVQAPRPLSIPACTDGILTSALFLGRFSAPDLAAAAATAFIPETTVRPGIGAAVAGRSWIRGTNGGDRFLLRDLPLDGPGEGPFATYLSFWISSPIDLGDLLGAGPDLPQVSLVGYVARRQRIWVNGGELEAAQSDPADYRQRQCFRLPLRQGWNHVLLKIAGDALHGTEPATIAVRLVCDNRPDFLRSLRTAIELRE